MKSRSTRFQSFESLEDKRIFLDIYKLLRNTRTTPLGGSIMPKVFRNFSVSFNYMRWKLTTPQTQKRPALMPWSSWQDSTSHKRELRAVHCTHCTRCTLYTLYTLYTPLTLGNWELISNLCRSLELYRCVSWVPKGTCICRLHLWNVSIRAGRRLCDVMQVTNY